MQTWGLTDPGNIRQQNQDSYAIVPFARDRVLMIVCDGMGGAKSGNVASSLAVEVFTGEVRRTQKAGMTPEKALDWVESDMIPFYPLGVYKDTDVKKLNPTSTKEEN